MSLASTIRRAVAVANRATESVKCEITLEPWISHDSAAKPTFDAAVTLKAIVVQGPTKFRTSLGDVIEVRAIVNILESVEANGADDRQEPIDPRDRITLPNGVVGAPILGMPPTLVDPETTAPYLFSVGLG